MPVVGLTLVAAVALLVKWSHIPEPMEATSLIRAVTASGFGCRAGWRDLSPTCRAATEVRRTYKVFIARTRLVGLHRTDAAIDRQGVAGGIAGLVEQQPYHGVGNLIRPSVDTGSHQESGYPQYNDACGRVCTFTGCVPRRPAASCCSRPPCA
jgi:hypothetical protein